MIVFNETVGRKSGKNNKLAAKKHPKSHVCVSLNCGQPNGRAISVMRIEKEEI